MIQQQAPPTISQLQRRIAYLEEVNEAQKKVIADERRQNAELRWHDEIMSNRNLPIAARFAARAVRKFTQERKPCDDGFFKGYLPKMEELAGVSASTISRGLELLSSATEAIEKHTEELRDDKGHVEKNVLYFRPSESFEAAAEIKPIKEVPKHGGNRRLPCPECGEVHRRVKRREECAACGHKFFEREHIIRGDEESLQDATDGESEESPGDLEPLQDETSEPEADPEKLLQLATLTVDTGVLPCNETSVEICPSVASCNELPPAELRALPIWCPWRYEEPEKPRADGRLDKVPYQTKGRSLQKAKPNDATTWTTYDQAQAMYERSLREGWKYPFDGIGFMSDGSFVGIDLDHCRDKETGEIAPWAQSIIDRFPSYGYITPSKEGVRIVIRAEKPGPRCKKGDIEIYEEVRFFTWTPMQLPGTPATIEDCQEQLTALYDETFPPAPPLLPKDEQQAQPCVYAPCQLPDEEVLRKARGASNGILFTLLWEGKWEEVMGDRGQRRYATHSEADLAFCRMLAYWTDDDPEAMDRLFRRSGLYRAEKWDRKARAGETYGEGTIRKARGV